MDAVDRRMPAGENPALLTHDGRAARADLTPLAGAADAGAVAAAPGSPLPNFTDQEIADYLRDGFWAYRGTIAHQFNLQSTGVFAKSGVLSVKFDGWAQDADGVTAQGKTLAWHALRLFENVLNIDFVEVQGAGTTADIYFGDADTGAYANSTFSIPTGNISHSWVNVSTAWLSNYGTSIGSYGMQTYIHEVGHALGLGHAGPYDGSASFITDSSQATSNNNIYLNDSWQRSVMSYMDQTQNTTISASYSRLLTPMIADWVALDDMPTYSTAGAYLGNTTYGFNTSISAAQSAIWNALSTYADRNAFHIIDSGGVDTIDFSGYSDDQTIDLAGGSISDIGGRTGNMTISTDTVIENAVGGTGDDTLRGNAADNTLFGNAGSDTLFGISGTNVLHGGAGDDILNGGTGTDHLYGDGGNDLVHGGAGSDYLHSAGAGQYFGDSGDDTAFAGPTAAGQSETLDGGTGVDLLDTTAHGGDYVIDLGTGLTNLINERFPDFEWLRTGEGNDTLTGTAGDNVIWSGGGADNVQGLAGNDRLLGAGGDDTLDGGDGDDYLAGNAGDDTLSGGSGTDTVYGGDGDDTLRSGGAGRYFGGSGNDAIHAGPTDPFDSERLNGGDGTDRLFTDSHAGDYVIDLATGRTSFSYERFVGFEELYAGEGNDTLTGTAGDNGIWGNGGNDIIAGGDGADMLAGNAGDDSLSGGAGNDVLLGGEGADTLDGGAGDDTLDGGAGDDLLDGGGGVDSVQGGDGDDRIFSGGDGIYRGDAGDDILFAGVTTTSQTLLGGIGADTLDTTRTAGDRLIDLGASGSQSGRAGEDFREFQHVRTGDGADTITGSDLRNVIFAGAGDDVVEGGKGWDRLHGEAGSDRLFGGIGGDRLYGGDGDDYLDAGTGADRLEGGAGNDTYRIFETRQVVIEADDGGTDTVISSADFDLSANGEAIESLKLAAGAAIDGTGNGGANTITGNASVNVLSGLDGADILRGKRGDDWLDGGLGDDEMHGGLGDDTFVVDSAGDSVVEGRNHGKHDVILSGVTLDLDVVAPYVETLTLTGSDAIDGFGRDTRDMLNGNAGSNMLDGRAGRDVLAGGGGDDILTGGRGADMFVLNLGDGEDTITDLDLDRDRIRFDSGAGGYADLAIAQVGQDAHVGYGSGDLIVLLGVDAGNLTETVFVF